VTPDVRIQFQEELRDLERQTLGGLALVATSLERALTALAREDGDLAALVIADDDRIDGRYLEVHQGLLSLLARQAPVAGDLRLVAALLHTIHHIERMGDGCVNIAKLLPVAAPAGEVAAGLLERLERMGVAASALMDQTKRAFETRDVALAEDLVRADDEIDRLNRECFTLALAAEDDPAAREWATRMILIARSLERLGDHAVDIGEQTAFVVTGLFREFTDASHPV